MVEWWNNEIIVFHAAICKGCGGKTSGPPGLRRRHLSARRAPSHHSNIPTFHHSHCERSELRSISYTQFPDGSQDLIYGNGFHTNMIVVIQGAIPV